MISEHKFASSFTSVWHEITPLSDGYWKLANLALDRRLPPLKSRAVARMRGVVNELAFLGFVATIEEEQRLRKLEIREAIAARVSEAVAYVNRMTSRTADGTVFTEADMSAEAQSEAAALSIRLLDEFRMSQLVLRPKFPGCGFMSAAEGDLISNGCLFEIKAGERNFRLVDLRQLLVYAALAYGGKALTFDRIALFNPRTGLLWARSLDDVCRAISGRRSTDVLDSLLSKFCATVPSR